MVEVRACRKKPGRKYFHHESTVGGTTQLFTISAHHIDEIGVILLPIKLLRVKGPLERGEDGPGPGSIRIQSSRKILRRSKMNKMSGHISDAGIQCA
jgi:hypothetical protein